ncbi:MAG: PilN domain-containing protein [Candidatus Eisenbacteria bacterium]
MIRINLIPRDERVTTKTAGPNWILVSGVTAPLVYALILGALVTWQNHRSVVLDEMIHQEEQAMEHYGPALAKIDQLTKERKEVRSRLDAMDGLDRSRRLAVALMETLNRSVPRFLWVDTVEEVDEGGLALEIKGNTFSNLIVSDFIERLEETELFEIVELSIAKEARIGKTRVVEFRLVVRGTGLLPEEYGRDLAGVPSMVKGG